MCAAGAGLEPYSIHTWFNNSSFSVAKRLQNTLYLLPNSKSFKLKSQFSALQCNKIQEITRFLAPLPERVIHLSTALSRLSTQLWKASFVTELRRVVRQFQSVFIGSCNQKSVLGEVSPDREVLAEGPHGPRHFRTREARGLGQQGPGVSYPGGVLCPEVKGPQLILRQNGISINQFWSRIEEAQKHHHQSKNRVGES